MNIFPIKDDADYHRALSEIAPYFDNPSSDEDPVWDSFDVMATLIEEYEKRHFPLIDNATTVDAIRFYIDQKGLTPKDLIPCVGRLNRVYEILAGKRHLTLPMIRKFNKLFGIPLEFLVRGYNQKSS